MPDSPEVRIAQAVNECIECCDRSPWRAVCLAEFIVSLHREGWSLSDVIDVGQMALHALKSGEHAHSVSIANDSLIATDIPSRPHGSSAAGGDRILRTEVLPLPLFDDRGP